MKAPGKAKEISPFTSAAEDLDTLRRQFRESVKAYGAKIEGELARAKEALVEEGKKPKPNQARIRDARDIGTLVRNLDLKPEKGRRRDLKKIETASEEIAGLVEGW